MNDFGFYLIVVYIVIGVVVGATWPIWVWFLGH